MDRRVFLSSVSALTLLPLIPRVPPQIVVDKTLVMTDVVFTASGESVGPFRYVALFAPFKKSLVLDYGSDVTLIEGESFTIDLGGKNVP